MNSGNRTFLLLMLMLIVTTTTKAHFPEMPNIEFAKYPCELISERRVFVDAPFNQRDEIVKQLTKHSDLVIVERPEEADFFLTFTNALQVAGAGNFLQLENAETAAAEIVVWTRVNDPKGGERQRVLLHWSGRNSFYSVTVPWSGITSSGFHGTSSGKKAGAELIGRGVIELISRIWPDRFQVDQLRNQVTIIKGGKLETEGAKWFLHQLTKIRNGFYAGVCPGRPLTPPSNVLSSFPSELVPEPVFASDALPAPVALAPHLLSGSWESIPSPPKPVPVPSADPLFQPSPPNSLNPTLGLGPMRRLDSPTPRSGRQQIFPPGSSQAPPDSSPVRLIEPMRPSNGPAQNVRFVRTD